MVAFKNKSNYNIYKMFIILYISTILLRFTFFPANLLVNFIMVFFGFLVLIYVMSNIKNYNEIQFIFIAGLLLFYLASALLVENYERVFHGLVFIIINCIIAMALIIERKKYWIELNLSYIVISYFVFKLIIGINARDVFDHTSYNSISIILITSCIVMYIYNYTGNRKISLVPALLTFLLCVWAMGRGGIISSFFLVIGIFYYKYPRKLKIVFFYLFLCFVIFMHFFELPFNALVDYFSFLEAVQLAVDRSEQQEERIIIINDYIGNLKFYNLIFGVNIFENPSPLLIELHYNLHNSFLNLHSKLGLYSFVVIFASFFSLYRFYFFNKLYLILFSTLLLRGFTDGFLFFESLDFIYYYFILYSFAYNCINLKLVSTLKDRPTGVS